MNGYIVVLCTCASGQEARRIAEAIVESKLAACVNLLGAAESVYRWEGRIETAHEVLLMIKSTAERFDELRIRITELHSYETPEIIALPVAAGSEKYLHWLRQETGENKQST
jgi:periplasmic divalent cation tolerance protein